MKFVREQFFLAASAQNLKRLVRFLARPPQNANRNRVAHTEKEENNRRKHHIAQSRL